MNKSNTDLAGIDAAALRDACNAAFHELGLCWCWEASHVQPDAGTERDCVRAWLAEHQAHMLAAYDADFLVDLIVAAMTRCARPAGAVDWRAMQQRQVGV
jgi:hypothetical protein